VPLALLLSMRWNRAGGLLLVVRGSSAPRVEPTARTARFVEKQRSRPGGDGAGTSPPKPRRLYARHVPRCNPRSQKHARQLALHSVDLPESDTLRGDLKALQETAVAVFIEGDGSFAPRPIRESGHHPEIGDLLHTVIHTRRLAYHRILGRAIPPGCSTPTSTRT
jgi:hypothetical protein